jgi:tetratricopeptide (TPR) repeat protein
MVLIFERSKFMVELLKSRPLISLTLVLLITGFVLFPTLSNGWLDWDDKVNILDNNLVKGLSWQRIKLIFQTPEVNGLYMPIPIITWALNVKFGGWDPLGFHVVNLVLHLGVTTLVFFLVKQLTNQVWTAILTALLFGIHPLHVESVAWITGRRDLVYSFFLLGSMLVWLWFIGRKKHRSILYLLSLFLFTASLLSKSVAVVLPLFLLLADYYQGRTDLRKMLLEKVPFFVLSLVFGLLTIYTQTQTAALSNLTDVPYYLSAITSSYSLTLYLIQSVVPFQIGGFHPYPVSTGTFPWYMLISVLTPIVLIAFLILNRHKKDMVFGIGLAMVGFLPVIQLLPVGDALVTDRYTYIPYLGLFFLYSKVILWAYKKLEKRILIRNLLTGSLIGYFIWIGYTANASTHIWKNTELFWSNVIDQHPHNEKGYINRGRYRMDKGQLDLAKSDYDKALKIAPQLPVMHQELGLYYQRVGEYLNADKAFKTALNLDSLYHPARLNLGINHMRLNQLDQALETFKELEALDPKNILVHLNIGVILEGRNEFDAAIDEYSKAIQKQPLDSRGYQYRGVVLVRAEEYEKATKDINKWIDLSPRNGKAYLWKSRVSFLISEFNQALSDGMKANELGASVDDSYLMLINDSINSSN